MCGRFAQYNSQDAYFDALGLSSDDIQFNPNSIGRYNVAPGTRVLLLHENAGHLQFDPVHWAMPHRGGKNNR